MSVACRTGMVNGPSSKHWTATMHAAMLVAAVLNLDRNRTTWGQSGSIMPVSELLRAFTSPVSGSNLCCIRSQCCHHQRVAVSMQSKVIIAWVPSWKLKQDRYVELLQGFEEHFRVISDQPTVIPDLDLSPQSHDI